MTLLACKYCIGSSRFSSLSLFDRILFMGGTSCIVIGFSFATEIGCEYCLVTIWNSQNLKIFTGNEPETSVLIAVGLVILVAGGYYEKHTSRDSLFPQTTFQSITTGSFSCWAVLIPMRLNTGSRNSWHSSDQFFAQRGIHSGNILPCSFLSGLPRFGLFLFRSLKLISDLGGPWIDPLAIRIETPSVLSRIVVGVNAGCLVHQLLAVSYS